MKTILILGAGKEQVNAIDRAKEKGIRTVVFDMNPEADGASHADEFYPVSTRDVEAITSFVQEYKKKIDGVMTIASDIPHCVSAAAEILRVPHIPRAVAEVCVNKLEMKEVLQKGGVNVPAFVEVSSLEDLTAFIDRVGYPVVLKPIDNSGARGISRLTERSDLKEALAYAQKHAFSGRCIAEKYIDGLQISTEGLMYKDTFYCTGFADRNYVRVTDESTHLVEDGGDIPTVLPDDKKRLVEEHFEKAVRALGIDWGPAKCDLILGTDGKVYIIEIAARLSGGNFCYDKVPWSTGVDIVDILIDMAVGNDVDPQRFVPTKHMATSQRYFFPPPGTVTDILGVDEALKLPHIKKIDIWVKKGDIVPPAINHPSRIGYVIALTDTLDEAVSAAEKAVNTIRFVIS
ncbi:hypothetical protein COU19_00365 [Candidatus Kaiserbacteria bacterium CG10_big_fil_rev_8_21_14_0_10_56_12]|uniref:ATP-grasp domain-containing protein n=1 Tax=Candidatus Kaiserbacteria bacterium CG10_big_fil_rev_8_21_14_0_10_56_12 TaxID=1974611 RepID=A0A2H0UAN0_9BACT|nr:MAG: hypothetical protein COU19_00365 [Candidatus Kaiserbacteria bacterium CG10_big_fil_rev_8_21_14_0_10_56_12]